MGSWLMTATVYLLICLASLLATTALQKRSEVYRTAVVAFRQNGQSPAQTAHASPISTVAFSPSGELLASGSHDRSIKFWSTKTGELQKMVRAETGPVESITFSRDGQSGVPVTWPSR